MKKNRGLKMEEWHEYQSRQIDANGIRQKQIEGEIMALISEYAALERVYLCDDGKIESFRLELIRGIVDGYVDAQKEAFRLFYSDENAKGRAERAFDEFRSDHHSDEKSK